MTRAARWLDGLAADLRSAVRNVRRYPVAAAVIVLSLAGGVGAATAALIVRDVVFRNPPPLYAAPQQLSHVQVAPRDRPILPVGSPVPAPLFRSWERMLGSAIAGADPVAIPEDVRTPDGTSTTAVRGATASLFRVLGIQPRLGRFFDVHDRAVAVLGYDVWLRMFGGREDVIGQQLWIRDTPYTVIGVAPERFWFGSLGSPIWTLVDEEMLAASDTLQVIVRRPPGVTPDTLAAQLERAMAEYVRQKGPAQAALHLRISDARGTPMGDQMSMLLPYVLGASVLLVLLIACANAAVLLIAQWTSREGDIAIRCSLGAARIRIVRFLLTEAIVLSVAAGVLGVVITLILRGWIIHRAGPAPLNLSLDPRILLQATTAAVVAGFAAGLAPALYETSALQLNPLRGLQASDRIRQRWSHALVIVEIVITVALLVEASSMVAAYRRLRTAELGFTTRPLLTLTIERSRGVPLRRVVEALEQVPGVAIAAPATSVPLFGRTTNATVATESSSQTTLRAERAAVASSFFDALGVSMRAGRGFDAGDANAERAVVINESLAHLLTGTGSAVGRTVWIDRTAYTVVGVVADFNTSQTHPIGPSVFVPLDERHDPQRVQVLVRTRGAAGTMVETLRRTASQVAPGVRVTGATSFDSLLEVSALEMLAGTAPLVPLIAIGMLLMAAGIYGVLAFAVARRARELAVRVAIGATTLNQVVLVAYRSARLLALGSFGGVALTFALSRVVRASGGTGSMYDPPWPAFVIPVLIVCAVGVAATWVPSRRVRQINPVTLLRST